MLMDRNPSARFANDSSRLFLGLHPMHRALHLGIEVLHTQTYAVEADLAQQRERPRTHLARMPSSMP